MSLAAVFRRQRPYLVAVAAVLLIVLLPSRDHGRAFLQPSRSDEGAAVPAEDQPSAERAPTAAGPDGSATTTVTTSAPAGATSGNGASTRRARVASTAAPGVASTVLGVGKPIDGYPGIDTPAALAAPDCDPATRRIKIVSWYAPPCVAPWPAGADNGGATSPGVTRDTISVVDYYVRDASNQTADQYSQAWADALPIYERFWRTWGRKVKVTMFSGTGADEVSQRADAQKIAALHPFAMYVYAGDTYRILIGELAARGILTLTASMNDAKFPLAYPGLVFSDLLAPGQLMMAHAVEYVGKRLVGRPARWAGDAIYRTQQRTFGLLYPDSWDPEAFKRGFSKYGGAVKDAIGFTQNYDVNTYQERARLMVAKFKDEGVNSVVDGGDVILNIFLSKEATNQNWFPEWVLTGTGACVDTLAKLSDPLQFKNAFGLCEFPPPVKAPTKTVDYFDWYYGSQAGSRNNKVVPATHALFTGIHLAGPRLTPQTFKAALFAVPPSGGAACNCVLSNQISWGKWGFAPWDDYNAYDDFADVWWDPQFIGPDNVNPAPAAGGADTPGHFRYMDGARRFLLGQWPTNEPAAFDPQAATDAPQDYPAREVPPQYPCTGCPSQ